jgi:hypothetical protein
MAITRACLLALIASGCASGWHADKRELCAKQSCYRLGDLDESWREIRRHHGQVAFFSDTVGGVIATSSVCREDADAAPLEALTNRLLIGYTDRNEISTERVTIQGREALHSVIEAKLDGVPVTLDLYVMKRNGCIVDLSFAAPVERYKAGQPQFERFVHSLTATRT